MTKKSSLLALISTLGLFTAAAHADGWIGYANVFNNNNGAAGSYVFGDFWGVSALKTTVAVENTGTYIGDRLILEPNYNAYADSLGADNGARDFWTNSTDGGVTAGPAGNKFFEGNTFVQINSISTSSMNFSGIIESYTLASGYSASAFIKVLNQFNGYTLDLFQTYDLALGGSFNISADLSAHQGKILQLGFMVGGVNANPANTGLGNATVTVTSAIPEPSAYAAMVGLVACGAAVLRRRRR